ncbi:type II toxin-antitoxin system Phd/YefM family antitoxin [Nitrosomonas europaea]|uniref:type II toxin-antitoxin system Phd/YefM family antitoxin n=1 Tax=Nitrosomonas europaea TaxID=915 RepID=UPI0023F3EC99|nr:type II toxin-antitoxin system Phd/YefM family antitoxin [Nitrosomonas europaea]
MLKVHAEALGIETLEVEVMKVYSLSEARQNFAAVLDNAQKEGAVRIMRRDGRIFIIQSVGGIIALRRRSCTARSESA